MMAEKVEEEFMDTNSNKPYQQPVSSTGSLEQEGGGRQKETTDTTTMIPTKKAAADVEKVARDFKTCIAPTYSIDKWEGFFTRCGPRQE
ncbi:MAG: hypothetical protein ACR2IS_19715 [Nitrososphaeraceae archaeon]